MSDPQIFVADLVYLLNYKPGQETMDEIMVDREWLGEELDQLFGASTLDDAALLETPVTYDPDAWEPISTEQGMFTCRDFLRPLVDSWLAAGSDIDKWSSAMQFAEGLRALRVRLFKTDSGSATFHFVKPPKGSGQDDIWAVEFMYRYITSPLFNRIGQCENPKCSRYFFKKTQRGNQRFCSDGACGKNFYAAKSTAAARHAEREAKLKRVRQRIENFKKLPQQKQQKARGTGLKRWLANQEKECGVTSNFITKAVKQGEVALPE